MPEAQGYMVAAYILTVVVLVMYTARISLHARKVARRLAAAQTKAGGPAQRAGSRSTLHGGGRHVGA